MSFCKGITLATLVGTMSVAGIIAAVPQSNAGAQADQYERVLAGIRLNSRANSVLKAFGNPNDVVVGDVGIREAPASAGGTAAGGGASFGGPGAAGVPGGRSFGGPSGPASFSGGPLGGGGAIRGGSGGGAFRGSGPLSGAPSGASFGGAPSGASFGGPPSGFGGGAFGGARDDGDGGPTSGGGGGFGGFGGFSGSAPGGGGVGQFGQTTSNLTPQQETTWIYNRRVGKDVVSYEFLIGQGGAVTQIRTIGYAGGNAKTRKSIVLGSTYKEVVQKYGYPEQQYRAGRSLLASYKTKNHVLFQFLNQRGQSENPFSAGNKVIAITIASVE